MLKRILVILVAVFVVFAMLGCDNGSKSSTTTSKGGSGKKPKPEAPKPAVIPLGEPTYKSGNNRGWTIGEDCTKEEFESADYLVIFNTVATGYSSCNFVFEASAESKSSVAVMTGWVPVESGSK